MVDTGTRSCQVQKREGTGVEIPSRTEEPTTRLCPYLSRVWRTDGRRERAVPYVPTTVPGPSCPRVGRPFRVSEDPESKGGVGLFLDITDNATYRSTRLTPTPYVRHRGGEFVPVPFCVHCRILKFRSGTFPTPRTDRWREVYENLQSAVRPSFGFGVSLWYTSTGPATRSTPQSTDGRN